MRIGKINLKICGVVSKALLNKYCDLVNYRDNSYQVLLFCDFSNFDIPINYTFSQIEDLRNENKIHTKVQLKGVSQEFGVSFELVPKGYKTICNFQFIENEIPEIINSIPVINNWYESDNTLIFI